MESSAATARLALFMREREPARNKAESWDKAFRAVGETLTAEAQRAIARAHGVSERSVRRLHARWLSGGQDAVALIDRRLSPDRTEVALTPEFVEYWRGLCEQNQRKCAPAYRLLLRQWRDPSVVIPGLPPTIDRRGPLPRGFSRQNLMRHAPDPYTLRAARVGRTSAAMFRPLVYTTRVGLQVGQQIMFDDMWHDFEVAVPGQRRASRLLQLHAHDVFSACQFARGLKPRIWDEASGRSQGLDQDDMLFLVAHSLGTFGYHPEGTVLLLENGTATLPDHVIDLLTRISGGLVTVKFADIQSAASFAGQYDGRGKGNFRFKATLESSHNLIHNETAGLIEFPGQSGSNSRLNAPEELHGRERALSTLELAIAALPAPVAAELRRPFVELGRAVWMVEAVIERINARTDHRLEGWIEAGLTAMEYSLPGGVVVPASHVDVLPEEKRRAIEAVASPRVRRLSPREVFDAGRARLVRFRPEQGAALLERAVGREVVVGKNHLIEFVDPGISPSPLRFLAHTLSPGEKFRAVVNPHAPDAAQLFDAGGRWCGAVRAWQAVSRLDEAALRERMSEARQIEAQLLQPLARRGAALTQQRIADAQHNALVISQHLSNEAAATEVVDRALLDAND